MESVLLYVLGILVIVLGLAISIGLHELGHLIPAKLFKVEVTQYMIGFGPTIFSRRRGETEYGLKAIPLGGYIAMTGMYPPDEGDEAPRASSTGFFNALVQEGAAMPAKGGSRAADGEPLDPAASTEASGTDVRAPGRTGLEADTVPPAVALPAVSGAVADAGLRPATSDRSFYRLPVWRRVVIMLGGPLMNLVLAAIFLGIVLVGFGAPVSTTTVAVVHQCLVPGDSGREECAPGDPDAPAAAAGILPGDTIVGIDGVADPDWDQLSEAISAGAGRSLPIEVLRDGRTLDLTIEPVLTAKAVVDARGNVVRDANGDPVTVEAGMIGISPTSVLEQQPITAVPPALGDALGQTVGIVLSLPQRMVDIWNAAFGGAERDPNGPMSVVGVGRVAGEIAALDQAPVAARVQAMLGLLASLNLALFVFNLIPLPPLDGGHVVVALFDGVRRRLAKLFGRPDPGPVNGARLVPVTLAIVVVLGAMSLLLIYADLVNPVNLFG